MSHTPKIAPGRGFGFSRSERAETGQFLQKEISLIVSSLSAAEVSFVANFHRPAALRFWLPGLDVNFVHVNFESFGDISAPTFAHAPTPITIPALKSPKSFRKMFFADSFSIGYLFLTKRAIGLAEIQRRFVFHELKRK